MLDTLYSPGGFDVPDCALNDRQELYVCDSRFASPGLHVFSTVSDLHVAGPLDSGLPPYQVIFDQAGDAVAVRSIKPDLSRS